MAEEWNPIIYRGEVFQFPFHMRDELAALVPLTSVVATLHDCPGEIEMAVTEMEDPDEGKFLIRLEGPPRDPEDEESPKGTADISTSAVRLCVTVEYTDGDEQTVIDRLVDVTEC